MTKSLLAAILAAVTLTAVAVDDAGARARHPRYHPNHTQRSLRPAIVAFAAPDVAGCVSACWGYIRAESAKQRKGGHRRASAPRAVAEQAVVSPGHEVGTPIPVTGGGSVVAEARRYIGGNPTGRGSLWCATFMNLVLERTGRRGTGSNMAESFAGYGTRVSGPQVGAIAVMHRGRRGGHVGVVSGIDARGNPIIISGNHGHRVAESVYPRSRIYAYVVP